MADITNIVTEVNAEVDVTKAEGAAAFTIDLGGRRDDAFVILIENTDSSNACRVTISAGVGQSASQGDLEIDIATSSAVAVGMLESARFKNADGKIDVAVLDQDDSEFTGDPADVKFTVLELPKSLTD